MSRSREVDRSHANWARALWIEAPGRAALREQSLAAPQGNEARVKTLWSAISRGTERLVFEGRVPASEHARMRAPFQEGDFGSAVKYGYCAVGVVEEGPQDWLGKNVFALHPHQTRFVAPIEALRILPDDTPPRRAALAANMETALNALWDSNAGPGDRIAIIGGGVLGLLIAALSAKLPGAEIEVVDTEPSRAAVAQSLGARFRLAADYAPAGDSDVVFHTSASAAGLALALESAGLEAKVVELSWYGEGEIAAPLGRAFHAKRLQLVSSQVGQVSPARRPRWSYARRLDKALDLLGDARLDALITEELSFDDAPREWPRLLARHAPGLATVLRY